MSHLLPLLSVAGLSPIATYVIGGLIALAVLVVLWWAVFKKKSD